MKPFRPKTGAVPAIPRQTSRHDSTPHPAEQVFKNVQWLKGVPAGNFLGIMNGGYSKALGVTCTHCHVETDFASDEKRPKKAAREMQAMHRGINDQLRKLQHLDLKEDERLINCATCHRGAINPRDAVR
jgi:hypothetical protein